MADKKLQVKRQSGKIFGPYTQREVLSFIFSKKLDGSEKVMFEGSSKWQDINSVNEFFDAFQEVLFGIEPQKSKTKIPEKPGQTVTKQFKASVKQDDDQTAVSSKQSDGDSTRVSDYSKEEKAPVPVKSKALKKKTKKSKKQKAPKQRELQEEQRADPSAPPESVVYDEVFETKKPTQKRPKASPLRLVTILLVLGMGSFLYLDKDKQVSGSSSALDISKLNSAPIYFRPLIIRLAQVLPLDAGVVPGNLSAMQNYKLPNGLGAHLFVSTIAKVTSIRANQRSTQDWAQLVWSLKWLGNIVKTYDEGSAEYFESRAATLYQALDSQQVLPPDFVTLYECIVLISNGNLEEASKKLESVGTEYSAWLHSEVDWLLMWRNKVSPEAWSAKHGSLSPPNTTLEAKHVVKNLFLAKSEDAPFWLEQLAVEDPVSFSLWFVGAEYFWRVNSSLLQKSYLYWQAGLAVASLYPKPFQEIMINEASELIGLYGRSEPAQALRQNAEIISSGDVFASKNSWQNIFGEQIDTDLSTDRTLEMGAERRLSPTELASLQSLSFTLTRRGGEKLLQVAYYFIFEKDYPKALETIEAAINFADAKEEAWGAKLWVQAEQFNFDKAFISLEKVKQSALESPKDQVYEAILYYFGRETELAKELFEAYLKKFPASGLGHFFQARLFEGIGKNVDCAKAAYLGGSNGVGEIGFRSRMLFYRCRVLAKLNVSNAIADLRKIFQKDPSNTAAVVEYIRALSNASLDDQAIEEGRLAVQRYPRSYPLRLALGDAYFKAQEYDKALAFYNNARQFRPESAEAFVKIGELLYEQERYLKAAENYRTAATLNPEYPEVWLKAAESFKKAGDKEEAVNAYKKEIAARPSVVQTFLDFSEYLLEQNRPQEVVDVFSENLAAYNNDPRVAVRLAQAYMGLQEFSKARERAAFAQAQIPTNAQVYRVLAIIAEVEGNYPSAKRHFEKYLSLVPQASDADAIRQKISKPPF